MALGSAAWHGLVKGHLKGVDYTAVRESSHILRTLPLFLLFIALFLQLPFANASAYLQNDSSKVLMNDSILVDNNSVIHLKVQDSTEQENSNTFNGVAFQIPVLGNAKSIPEGKAYESTNDNFRKHLENFGKSLYNFIIDTKESKTTKRSKRSINVTSTPETPSGTFELPNPNTKMTELENKITQMEQTMHQIRNYSTISVEDKTRLSVLESTVEILKKAIFDKNRNAQQSNSLSDEVLENFIGTFNGFRKELDNMKIAATERERTDTLKKLPKECIEFINKHDIATANIKLEEIKDDSEINGIVKGVYDHKTGNFDLVLQFGDSVNIVRRRFLVYKALSYELESNGHKDPSKIMNLIKSLREKVLFDLQSSDEQHKDAESVIEHLRGMIKDVLKEMMKSGMINNYYQNNTKLMDMSNEIKSFDYDLFCDTIKEVVAYVYGRIDTIQLVSYIESNRYFGPVIAGLIAVFDEMKRNNDLSNNAIFRVAYNVATILDSKLNPNVDPILRDNLLRVKMELPKTVRLVAFPSTVCLRNAYLNEYLYAGVYKLDSVRRWVLTWVPKGRVIEGGWLFKYDRRYDCFYIKNKVQDEYLYADSSTYNDVAKRRRLFMWLKNTIQSSDEFCWRPELHGEHVQLRNYMYPEYLFADSYGKLDSDRRYVFTSALAKTAYDSFWLVEDCS